MFEVGVAGHFWAEHRLRGDFGPATQRHGHDYRVEIGVRGVTLREDGTLSDIAVLQEALDRCLSPLDGNDLDELSEFGGRNTTAEVVAAWLADALAPSLRDLGLDWLETRVFESPDAWASCSLSLTTA
jgi:6-pyruvoyltetrahydropterin/6-carboxytetrahydropterin synthase